MVPFKQINWLRMVPSAARLTLLTPLLVAWPTSMHFDAIALTTLAFVLQLHNEMRASSSGGSGKEVTQETLDKVRTCFSFVSLLAVQHDTPADSLHAVMRQLLQHYGTAGSLVEALAASVHNSSLGSAHLWRELTKKQLTRALKAHSLPAALTPPPATHATAEAPSGRG